MPISCFFPIFPIYPYFIDMETTLGKFQVLTAKFYLQKILVETSKCRECTNNKNMGSANTCVAQLQMLQNNYAPY